MSGRRRRCLLSWSGRREQSQLSRPSNRIISDIPAEMNRGTSREGTTSGSAVTVFVSHTSELSVWPAPRSCVEQAKDAAVRAGFAPVEMNDFVAQDRSPATVCEEAVRACDVYVAVVGFRYGSPVTDRDVSYTELEFITATDIGIPRIVVLLRQPPHDGSLVDDDRTLIDRFRARLMGASGLTVKLIDEAAEVESVVWEALDHLRCSTRLTPLTGWVMSGSERASEVRGHFSRRGMGQRSGVQGGGVFRGRGAALAAVNAWLSAEEAPGRPLVVTGQPGAGKSALLGRVVLDHEAQALERGLAFHARQATVANLMNAVEQLTKTRKADSIFDMVDRVRSTEPVRPWPIVIDALDEAASETERQRLVEAIVELAGLPQIRVVVATRDLAGEHRFAPESLFAQLGVISATSPNLVDLDEDRFFDADGLLSFCAALLRQEGVTNESPPDGAWATYRADDRLCNRLARAIAARAGRNYLVAALTASPLSRLTTPIDPGVKGIMESLPSSVGEALSKYLDAQPPRERHKIRGLLTALAYARGDGIDDRHWIKFATQLGYPTDVLDLDVLRSSPVVDYLLQTTLAPRAPVTRLFHQALVDELLAPRPRQSDERLIFDTLIPEPSDLAGEGPDHYVRQFLVTHAAAAGTLDAEHIPINFLPWETSGKVGVLLGFPRPDGQRHQHLNAWAALEPYLANADMETVRESLAFVIHASQRNTRSAGVPPTNNVLAPQWTRWTYASNILVHLPDRTSVRGVTTFVGPEGQSLVAGGCRDGAVRVWDVATGEQYGRTLYSPDATGTVWNVVSFVNDEDHTVLASCGEDGTVRVWGLNDGRETTLRGHSGKVRDLVTFSDSAGRRLVASAGYDRTVRIWDVDSAAPVGEPLIGHTDGVHSIAAFTDADGSTLLATGGCDGTLRVWNPTDGTEVREPITVYDDWVRAVLPIEDHLGRLLLATGGNDRRIRFWNPNSGEEMREPITLPGPGRVTTLTTTIGGEGQTLLVNGGTDRVVRVWDLRSGNQATAPKIGHTDWVSSVATVTTNDGRRMIVSTAGPDCTIRLWDPAASDSETSGTSLGWMRSVTFGPDRAGRLLAATGSGDATVRIWDGESGATVAVATGHRGWVRAVTPLQSAGGDPAFVSGGTDRTVRVWDGETGIQKGSELVGHEGEVWAVTSFVDAAGHTMIASGGNDKKILLRCPGSAAEPVLLEGHRKGIRGLTTFPTADGGLVLASVSADHTLRLWNPSTGSQIQAPIEAHDEGIRAVSAFSDSGRICIVTGGCDNAARIWDASTGKKLGEFSEHKGWVLTVATATHTCGRVVLLTGGGMGDYSLRVWDVPTQRQLARLVLGVQVQSVAVWPKDSASHEPLVAFASVGGVATVRLALDKICLSPSCSGGSAG